MQNLKKRIITGLFLLCALAISLIGCSEDTTQTTGEQTDEGGTVITLFDENSEITGSGARMKGGTLQILKGGTYELSGSLKDGQIYVETEDDEAVTLLFNGVSICNAKEDALYIEQADQVIIELAGGSENQLQSGESMPAAEEKDAKGGALFSRDDLVIRGEGALSVNGYVHDGIHANDTLMIESGSVTVNAIHHAVKANDALTIEGGNLDLTSGQDGLQSEGDLLIRGGEIAIEAGDDAIHADQALTVEDGEINITKSVEGLEANQLLIQGGNLSVSSSDDGINAYGGSRNMGKSTTENTTQETPDLTIDGGTIYVNAQGDGIDSNGNLTINGGSVLIDGPDLSWNGALDSGSENGGSCTVNGGTVLAIGASGMAEGFDNDSKQNSFHLYLETAQAGSRILIEDAGGKEIISHEADKSFSSLVFSDPGLSVGEEYTVHVGEEEVTFTLSDRAQTLSMQEDVTVGGFRGRMFQRK